MTTSVFTRRAFLATAAIGGVALLASRHGAHAAEAINTGPDGLAISGYDPVAYFTENAAVEGSADHTATLDGATYRFKSAENRALFEANPARYLPAYGGYCAFAVSKGALAKVDPEAFTLVDDKLYLNFSKSVRTTWSEDIPGNIARADENWPTLSVQ